MTRESVVNELHRDARKKFQRRRTEIRGLNETFQADLVEMIAYESVNRNYKYILTVIDVFSKYAWAIPIKTKGAKDVSNGMAIVLSSKRVPKNLQTDHGKEFYNRSFKLLMDSHEIHHYSTFSTKKAAIVERFNRTLKGMMWKAFSLTGTYKWLGLLPKLVKKYNNTKHRTIKMRPIDVTIEQEKQLLETVYKNSVCFNKHPKYKVGDFVRISKYKSHFDKGYTPNWTTEIFEIVKVQQTEPLTYKIKDYTGNIIEGGFYGEELLKSQHSNIYIIEKVLKRKGEQVFVKWLGFDSKHNSWVNERDVL